MKCYLFNDPYSKIINNIIFYFILGPPGEKGDRGQ